MQRAKLHAHPRKNEIADQEGADCAGGQGPEAASCAGNQAYTWWAAASFTVPIESMDGEVEGGSVRRRAARLACSSSHSLQGKEAGRKGRPVAGPCHPLEAG